MKTIQQPEEIEFDSVTEETEQFYNSNGFNEEILKKI